MSLTLAEIAKLNSGQGHIERLHEPSALQIAQPIGLPGPPSGDMGADLGVARVALVALILRADPLRRQADVRFGAGSDTDTYAIDVGSTTLSHTPPGGGLSQDDLEDNIFTNLRDQLHQASEPVLGTLTDADGDNKADGLALAGNWTRVTFTAAQSEDYTATIRGESATHTADGSLTGADLLDDIASGVASEISDLDLPFEAKAIDNDDDGLADVMYVAPTTAVPLQMYVSATGSGGATVDAAGDDSDVTYQFNGGTSTGSAFLSVAADATSVEAEIWGRSKSLGVWTKINDLDAIAVTDNWVESLQSLTDFDRGFTRVTTADGRVRTPWAPALG